MITIDELFAKILSNTCSNEEFNENISLFCDDYNNFERVCLALHQNTSITHFDFSAKFSSFLDYSKHMRVLAEVLKVKTSITVLNLNFNPQIGSKGIKIIVAALKDNTTLKTLSLANTQYHDEGAAEALAEMLKNNRSLTKLDVGRNSLTPVGINKIIDAIKNNTALKEFGLSSALVMTNKLAFGSPFDRNHQLAMANSIADLIITTRSISRLDLSHNEFPFECVAIICGALKKTSTQIISFRFSGNKIDDVGLNLISETLSRHKYLRDLELDSYHFKSLDSFAKYISVNEELRSLSIEGPEFLAFTPQVFDILEQHPRLTYLKNYRVSVTVKRKEGQIQKITSDLLALNKKFGRIEADVIINGLVTSGLSQALRNIVYLYLGYENGMEEAQLEVRKIVPLDFDALKPDAVPEYLEGPKPNLDPTNLNPPTELLISFNQQLAETRRKLLEIGRNLTTAADDVGKATAPGGNKQV